MGGASTIMSGPITMLLQWNKGLCNLLKSLATAVSCAEKVLRQRHHECPLKAKVLTPCWAEDKGRRWEGTERWENTKSSTDTFELQLYHANISGTFTKNPNLLIFLKVHKDVYQVYFLLIIIKNQLASISEKRQSKNTSLHPYLNQNKIINFRKYKWN